MRIVFDSNCRVYNFTLSFMEQATEMCSIDNDKMRDPAFSQYALKGSTNLSQRVLYTVGSDRALVLPRGFPLQEFEGIEEAEFVDKRHSAKPDSPWPKSLREPLPHQKEAYDRVLAAKDDPFGSYLLVLPVSNGKTTIASLLAKELNQKTLVLVDSKIIMQGWIKDLTQIFSMPTSAIGIIHGNKFKIGNHITIAMAQTLRSRPKYREDIKKIFGTIICDEAHVMPARTFFPILNEFPGKYRIGITATKERKDGLQTLLHLLFNGEFYVKPDPKGSTQTSMALSEVVFVPTDYRYPYDTSDDYNRFLADLSLDRERNELIASWVAREISLGNYPLVATKRVLHVNLLRELVMSKLMIPPRKLVVLKGGASAQEIDDVIRDFQNRSSRALFSTMSFIVKGANIPQLDTLFVCSPVGFYEELKQLIGRVKRNCQGKKRVKVYDFFDTSVRTCRDKVVYQHMKAYKEMHAEKFTNIDPENPKPKGVSHGYSTPKRGRSEVLYKEWTSQEEEKDREREGNVETGAFPDPSGSVHFL